MTQLRDSDATMTVAKPELQPAPGDFGDLVRQAVKVSELLKALSHETRLLILCLLSEGEKSVSELETILGLPQAAVSQQLARLRFDKLVSTRRDGRMIHYRIDNDEAGAVIAALYDIFCKPIRQDTP